MTERNSGHIFRLQILLMQWRIICSQVSFFRILKNIYGYAIMQEQVHKIQIIKKSEFKGPVRTHSRGIDINSN